MGSSVREKTRKNAILVGPEFHQTRYLGLRHPETVSSEPSQCSLDHLPCQPENGFLVESLKWGSHKLSSDLYILADSNETA